MLVIFYPTGHLVNTRILALEINSCMFQKADVLEFRMSFDFRNAILGRFHILHNTFKAQGRGLAHTDSYLVMKHVITFSVRANIHSGVPLFCDT